MKINEPKSSTIYIFICKAGADRKSDNKKKNIIANCRKKTGD